MSTALVKPPDAQTIEKVILGGDLKELKPAERLSYYNRVCESLGMNPLTQPFAYMNLSGKLTLYARKDAAEQLRKINAVSLRVVSREMIDGMYVVTVEATTPGGRTDASTGVIDLGTLKGEAKANAMMKAETKAKRRVTLSICGLGMIDETEVASIAGARVVTVEDAHSGKLLEDGGAAGNAAPEQSGLVTRPIPEELQLVVEALKRNDASSVKTVCAYLEKEMGEAGIGKRYEDRAAGLRSSFPKGKAIPSEVMITFLLDNWDDLQAKKAKVETPAPAEDKSDYLPEGFGE